jgi:hypothetical protein
VQAGSGEWVQQGGQPRSIGGFEPDPMSVELALQYRELVAEGEDLCVFLAVSAWQQPQERERVRDAEIGQS